MRRVIIKVLLCYRHYPVSAGEWWKRGFRRTGCQCASTGFSTGNHIWGNAVNNWKLPDLEIDEDWEPDLFAFVGKPDSQVYLGVADHYRRRGIPIIGICPDNHRQDLPPNCDFYFLAHDFPSIVKPPPDKPQTCLLYTSPSPRD